jgi:hypothetical protein
MKAEVPFLFAASLDGVLLPNTGKPSADGCLGRTCDFLGRLRGRAIPVVYVTDRPYGTARSGVGQFGLPSPTYWVCNAFTEIRTANGAPDPDWSRWLGPKLDVDVLTDLLGGMDGLVNVDRHLAGLHRFTLKLSGQISDCWIDRANQALAGYRNGLRVLANFDPKLGITRLEVLPVVAGQLQALDFLAQSHALPRHKVLFAGSGDTEALRSGVMAVLVMTDARGRSRGPEQQTPDRSGGRLYRASARFGDGVLEGLRYFNLCPFGEMGVSRPVSSGTQ